MRLYVAPPCTPFRVKVIERRFAVRASLILEIYFGPHVEVHPLVPTPDLVKFDDFAPAIAKVILEDDALAACAICAFRIERVRCFFFVD